jgi:phosphohistidine phosphatase
MTTPTSQRTLILLRHSKAEHVEAKLDQDRELSPQGRKDARAVGQWLGDPSHNLVIDLVLCSTSVRTRQTFEGICEAGASATDVRFDERIYEASASHLLDVLREVPDSVNIVLMIGHAPGVPVLAAALTQDDADEDGAESTRALDDMSQGYPTSGFAVLGFEGRWEELAPEAAHLSDFVVPRG